MLKSRGPPPESRCQVLSLNKSFSTLDHVGIVVENLDMAVKHFEYLGIGPFVSLTCNTAITHDKSDGHSTYDRSVSETRQAALGPANIQLIQPSSKNSFWREFLETKGEGIAHMSFVVDNIEREEEILVRNGLVSVYHDKFQEGGGVAGFETRLFGGTLMELVQLEPESHFGGERARVPYSGFHHVGFVVRDMDAIVRYYESLGFGPFKPLNLRGERTEASQYGKPVSNRKLRNSGTHIGSTKVELEFLQPVENAPVQEEFLNRRGEGANHLGFKVADVDSEAAKLETKGFRAIYTTTFSSGTKSKYLDVGKTGGLLFEFWQPPTNT